MQNIQDNRSKSTRTTVKDDLAKETKPYGSSSQLEINHDKGATNRDSEEYESKMLSYHDLVSIVNEESNYVPLEDDYQMDQEVDCDNSSFKFLWDKGSQKVDTKGI